MKKIEIAVLFALILAIILGNVSVFARECEQINESVLRLHVIANSDSEQDQALKLQVRDEILKQTDFGHEENLVAAEDYLAQHLDEIERVAQQKVYDLGYDYPVQAQMVRMWFPTKSYESVTLPAGEYDALRITIGSAQGKNWWCVLYPPLCIPAAQEDKQLDDVLNEEQLEIVQSNPKYEVRFQLLEWWDQLLQLFQA